MSVCMYNFHGCDEQSIEEDCAKSIMSTEGGLTTAVYSGGPEPQDVEFEARLTQQVSLFDDPHPCTNSPQNANLALSSSSI